MLSRFLFFASAALIAVTWATNRSTHHLLYFVFLGGVFDACCVSQALDFLVLGLPLFVIGTVQSGNSVRLAKRVPLDRGVIAVLSLIGPVCAVQVRRLIMN